LRKSENPNGIPQQSPGLPSLRGYPGLTATEHINPNGVAPHRASIPQVTLVKLHTVLPQQRPQLILKTYFSMMLFLIRNILLHLLDIRLTHREMRITALPFENRILSTLFFEPNV